MTDLERFFRRLVANLASTDPARLHRPIPLDDVRYSILPYRANRRALGLDSSEDYELVLLRLCAGEGGYLRTEPEEARVRFVQELRSPNPDLDVLGALENVLVTLRSEPLARALGPEPEASYAPPPPFIAQPSDVPEFPDLDPPAEPDAVPEEPVPPHCLYCGGALPAHRAVNFCPHCGQSQTVAVCAHCHGELEPGWRHCVNCGATVGPA
ncbi:MAG TPA: zinc ribbon domain-containing protein [Gemmatimonadales bacterium]